MEHTENKNKVKRIKVQKQSIYNINIYDRIATSYYREKIDYSVRGVGTNNINMHMIESPLDTTEKRQIIP